VRLRSGRAGWCAGNNSKAAVCYSGAIESAAAVIQSAPAAMNCELPRTGLARRNLSNAKCAPPIYRSREIDWKGGAAAADLLHAVDKKVFVCSPRRN